MKKLLVLITVFSFFTLISCGPSNKDLDQTQNQEQPTPVDTEEAQSFKAESSTEQYGSEVMLNPPHGEPNHRCDIPVGAPLNSPPANTNMQTTGKSAVNTTPITINQPVTPTNENAVRTNPSQTQSTMPGNIGDKPRLNPPHGQPHHRCDIPVGSSLP